MDCWRTRPGCAVSVVPIPVGGPGQTLADSGDTVAATEYQRRIDGQRSITEWGRARPVSDRAPANITVWAGHLRTAVLGSLIVATGDRASSAPSPVVPPPAVIVEDRCPSCRVGRLQMIWQAARPGRQERHRFPFSIVVTRMHPTGYSRFITTRFGWGCSLILLTREYRRWARVGPRHNRINSCDPYPGV